MAELSPDSNLSHYRIVSKLGAGGMGEVYLAQDTKLGRKVALKILPAEVANHPDRMKRFVQEAKAASALNHPNIITIHEIDQTDSGHFIATEFIDGVTLRERAHKAPMKLGEVLDIAAQIAGALSAAHAAGIIHRDIKPENVMLRRDGIVKVLDFGLAKLTERVSPQSVDTEAPTSFKTDPGTVVGTAVYMSPEQARGMPVDARTDIFSLGVLIYEMVAGRLPFAGSNTNEILASILSEKETQPLARYSSEVPAELERIVEKALRKDREQRYQVIKDLLIDLRSLKHKLDVSAEIERTVPPEGDTTNREGVPPPAKETAPVVASSTTSSAEYIVNQVKLHKRGAVVALGVLALVAVIASFWYFKHTRAAPLTDKDTILLADFGNSTGDPVFDGTLKQALAIQLEQSPFFSIFADEQVRHALRLMQRSPDEKLTRDVAREICERQGLKAFIAGAIAPLGSHYVLTLEAVNGHNGEVLAREQTESEGKEQVLKVLSQAASGLREKLGESLASIGKFDKPIEVTTSSLEAFKAYSVGSEQDSKGKYLEAIPFFERATELDPNFAQAYIGLAVSYNNTNQRKLGAKNAAKAYLLRDRVSEFEKFRIFYFHYSDAHETDKATDVLEVWKRTYPRDPAAPNNLSFHYLLFGQYEKSIEEAREAMQRNPNLAAVYGNLGSALLRLNRFAEARDVFERALQQKLDPTVMYAQLYQVAFVSGDMAEMQRQLDWAKGQPDEYVALDWQADTAAFAGRWRQAQDFSQSSIDLATRRNKTEIAAGYMARTAALSAVLSQCPQAKALAAHALALAPKESVPWRAGLALALCGETAQAQRFMEEPAKQYPNYTLLNGLWLPTIRAAIELQRGNAAQAIELLQPAARYEAAAEFWPQYLRGQAYLKLNRGAEAAAEFQEVLDHRGEAALSTLYSLAYLGLARATTLTGDTAKSRKAYEDFLALWKDADPDILILIEAKKEYEKLK